MNHVEQPMYVNLTSAASVKRFLPGALIVGLVGLVLALWGAFLNPQQFWRSYLLAYLFWLQMGLGCLGMVMLHHLVGGRWSALIRRLMETGAMTLPLLALLFVPLLFGLTTLYPWLNPEHLLENQLLQNKAIYLNAPFFIGRAIIYFVVWLLLAHLLNRWSLAQDRTGAPHLATRMSRLSAAGIILFMLTTTFAAFDWMMSLEPEWFSSIYGLMFIIGTALAALSVAIIGLRFLAGDAINQIAWAKSFNDLGNFMLGFVMIWAYFSFSQFLIIWSANIPEEAVWYAHRIQGGWQGVGLVLIAFHFVLPFFLLLSRSLKRKAEWLTLLALLILVTRFVDLFWLIVPAFYPEGIHIHWLDLVLLVTLGGGWSALFIWLWIGKAPLPQHDRHLQGIELRHFPELPAQSQAPRDKARRPGLAFAVVSTILLIGIILGAMVLTPRLLAFVNQPSATVPLRIHPAAEKLLASRAQVTAQLNGAGGADQKTGTHIPIDRAMALIAANGVAGIDAIAGAPPANAPAAVAVTATITATGATPTPLPAAVVDLNNVSFQRDVLPIFEQRCVKCHGGDAPEEGLELTSYRKLMNGSMNGNVIKAGDPDKSYLVEMISTGKMPKRGGPLTQAQIDTIVAWIKAGAVDDTTAAGASVAQATAVITATEAATVTNLIATSASTITVIISDTNATPTPVATVDLANVSFQRDVLPIFEQRCIKCHGGDNPEEGLVLTSYRTLMNGSMNGRVIKAGDPDKSYLVEMISTGKMPKRGGPLTQAQIDTIVAWIKAGAMDDSETVTAPAAVQATVAVTAMQTMEAATATLTPSKTPTPRTTPTVQAAQSKVTTSASATASAQASAVTATPTKTRTPTATATGVAKPSNTSTPTVTATPDLTATTELTATTALTASAPATTATVDLTNVSFQGDVLPIFTQRCFKCHGDDNPEEGLELTSYRKVMNGSMNGKVIKPGDPNGSYLVKQIVTGKMPKRGGPISPSEIDTIIAWIQAGALDN